MWARERSGSGRCRQELAWRPAGQPEQLAKPSILPHQRPESSPFSAQSKRDISWHDEVVLAQPLTRGSVPGRETRRVTRGLLRSGGSWLRWWVVAQEEWVAKPAWH